MAATNFTPISLYYSTTASAVPTAANLVPGELAINTNDGKLYYEDSNGVVQVLASKATSSGTFGAISATSITNSGLTTGRVVYTTTGGLETSSANLLYSGTDLTVYGLTVGRGNSAVSTNTALGASALAANTGGAYNSAVGYQSSQSIQGGGGNVSFGGLALRLNVSGDSNAAFGVNALENNTGSNNTGIGRQALQSNTTASSNTAVGYQAGYTNQTGASNTSIGYQAGYLNTGTRTTIIGNGAGYNSTGNDNTFVGQNSGNSITSGAANTIIGRYNGNQGGLDIRTASNYIVLSDGDGNPRGIFDSSGNFLVGTVNTTKTNTGFRVEGGVANTSRASTGSFFEFYDTGSGSRIGYISNSGGVATLYNTTSDQRLKTNIVDAPSGNIDNIKVRSFDWIVNDSHQPYGMVAQELIEVAPYAVNKPENSDEMMAVDYSKLVPMMIKEIQDLKARLTALESK
jgi:hypothetical protein